MSLKTYTPPPTKNVRPDEQVWLGKVGNDLELALAGIVYRLDSELTDAKASRPRLRAIEPVTDLVQTIKRLNADPAMGPYEIAFLETKDFAHVFELVDVTDDERYFTHGIFLTEAEAKEAATCDIPPYPWAYQMSPGAVKYEIRKRRVGFHPHEIGEVVLTREWIYRGDGPNSGSWTVKDTVPGGKPVSTA